MAIYYMNVGHISRSTGRSAVQNAAYITGASLYETRRDMTTNFENRQEDVAWSKTIAPEWAPLEFSDMTVWDKIESFEDDYAIERYPHNLEYRDKYMDSARTAMTVIVALPRELPSSVSIELLEEFIQNRFVSQDLIVTAAMHDDEGNPHGHLLISRRFLVRDSEGNVTFSWAKNREMCLKSALLSTRKLWAEFVNSYLEREGLDERISEKSYLDLGVDLRPSIHRGWVSDKLKDMGIDSRIMQENEVIWRDNKANILQNPEIILNEITAKQATFTQMQLLKILRNRLGDDDKNISAVLEAILERALYLGEGMDGIARYTSAQYQQKEQAAVHVLETVLNNTQDHQLQKTDAVAYLKDHYPHMTEEQHLATLGLLKGDSLAVLLGRAGTGKTTTTVKAVCYLYSQEGYTVIGGSLSKLATDNLSVEAGITAKTIHAWLYCWDRYHQAEQAFLSFDRVVSEGVLKQFGWYKDLRAFGHLKLTPKTLLVVDEAGMIGTDQWQRLLEHIKRAGAKAIAVGDDAQCKAIEAGDFFREILHQTAEKKCLFELNAILRQKTAWMRQASMDLATFNTQDALAVYEQKGHTHVCEEAFLHKEIASAYWAKLTSRERDDKRERLFKTGFVLAFTNEETRSLNQAIRSALRSDFIPGYTLSKDVLTLGKGDKATHFAIGDKIVFLKNDKKHIVCVDKNGQIIQGRMGLLVFCKRLRPGEGGQQRCAARCASG